MGIFAEALRDAWGRNAEIKIKRDSTVYEERLLALDSTKAEVELGWRPRWNLATAVARTVEWYKSFYAGQNMADVTARQCQEMAPVSVRPRAELIGA